MVSYTLKNGVPLNMIDGAMPEASAQIREEYSPEWKG